MKNEIRRYIMARTATQWLSFIITVLGLIALGAMFYAGVRIWGEVVRVFGI